MQDIKFLLDDEIKLPKQATQDESELMISKFVVTLEEESKKLSPIKSK